MKIMDQKCQYLAWPPFASCSATHLACIELIVACGVSAHSSSIAGYWQEPEQAVAHASPEHRPHQGQDPDPEHGPNARSLKTCGICGFVLCNKTAHFRAAFYCDQPKAHLCAKSYLLISILTCHTGQVDGWSWQRRSAHENRFKQIFLFSVKTAFQGISHKICSDFWMWILYQFCQKKRREKTTLWTK